MTHGRRLVSTAVAVAAVALVTLAGCGGSTASGPLTYEVTDFESGDDVSTESLRGAPAVLTSWTTWCTECDEVLSGLREFSESGASDGVQVVAVNLDAADVTDEIRTKFDDHGLTVPLWRDRRNEFKRVFGAIGVPTTVVLDADGELVATFPGAVDYDDPDVVAAIDQAGS